MPKEPRTRAMIHAVKQQTVIQPGGKVSIQDAELPEGRTAEVIVIVPDAEGNRSLVGMLGAASGLHESADSVVDSVRSERDSWG
ncbi:MAG: hypothetical protein K1X53_02990 [Candidatus Sumerlaeaceae bacterium]|nr:hypothetical protein [Candidatus Sumerlaeaceae bacterium]